MAKQNSTKVIAYELDYDIGWEPWLPPKDDPGYQQAYNETMRSESRELHLDDAWVDERYFPHPDRIRFSLPPRPGCEVFCHISYEEDYGKVPRPVPFKGVIDYLDFLDYPYNPQLWPMMSQQMFDTLISVGDFQHRTYAVAISDASDLSPGELPRDTVNVFYIVQTLEFLDAFDFDKSEYDLDPELEGCVDHAEKVVLKEPANGFPPLFRLSVMESRLYVSAAAKAALEAAGTARGVDFIPVDEHFHW